jgi:hypothetical protein
MTNLKNVAVNFAKTSAYDVLKDMVYVCGVDSVLSALAEIVAEQEENKRNDGIDALGEDA